jgi:two-component system, sensor histidine kinase and response regulator
MRILVAEDNLVNRELLQYLLGQLGHTVVVAADGLEVLEKCASSSFDLVLMDLWMPRMDGLAATAKLREQEKDSGRRTPIIAVTAHAIKGDRDACLQAGMDGYLTKPIRRQTLVDTISRVVPSHPVPESESKATVPLLPWEGVDLEILPRLGKIMIESTESALGELADALNAKDAQRLQRIAHSLKGSLALFKVQQAFALTKEIELAAQQQRFEAIGPTLKKLQVLMPLVHAEVAARAQLD